MVGTRTQVGVLLIKFTQVRTYLELIIAVFVLATKGGSGARER